MGTLPLLEALRHAHPRAVIGWMVQEEFADLLAGHPALDEVLRFERRAGLAGLRRAARDLERFGADWTVDAQGNWKSALVTLLSRAPRRSGFAPGDHQEPIASFSLNDHAALHDHTTRNHRAALNDGAAPNDGAARGGRVHALERLRVLALHVAPDAPFPVGGAAGFRVGDREPGRARFERTFGRDARAGARPAPVVIHVARGGDPRSWPAACTIELARELAADHDVLVVSGPREAREGEEVARALGDDARVRVWTEPLGLRELAAFLRAAAEAGAVFVGGDSGPMHLAWSAGLRVVLLAGPTDERETGPWPVPRGASSDEHRIVRAEILLACAPCRRRACAHPEGNVCLTRLAPRRVAAAVRALTSPTACRARR